MPRTCEHNSDKVIQTNHGYFCLECGKLTSKATSNKTATRKKAQQMITPKAAAKTTTTLLTHHKTPVLKAPTKLKVTDISV